MTIILSQHANVQASRRNFSYDDIHFVVKHGYKARRTGVIFFQMRDKNLPRHISASDPRRRLTGSTIVACSCGKFVITLYKNPKAFKKDCRKPKYNHNDEMPCSCPCCGRDFVEEHTEH
jgi:hypothetical protein